MSKVILLTYTFPPLSSGGTPVVLNMCRYLPRYNWEVIPVTVDKPRGMGTDNTLMDQLPKNLKVVRVPHGSSLKSSSNSGKSPDTGLKKALKFCVHNYVLIPDRVITWRRKAVPVLLDLIEKEKPECIISFGPHHSLHLIALEACRKTDTPLIPFFGDLWLADSYVTWPSRVNRFIEGLLERYLVGRARGIVATTGSSTGYFLEKYGDVCPARHVAENAYDPERTGVPAAPAEKGEYLTAGWTGNFFSDHTPEELLQGFEMFYTRNPDSRIRLKMAGGIDQASLNRLERDPLAGRVTHHGLLKWNEVPAFQKSCDLLLTFLKARRFAEMKNSSKTAEYLISGRAVLAIAPEGSLTERVKKYGRGYTVHPSAEEIALKLENLEYQWSTSSLSLPVDFRAIEERFSAVNVMKKLAGFLDRTTGL